MRLLLIPHLLVLAGCQHSNDFVAPPPPKVTVAQPLVEDVVTYQDFVGRTVPVTAVEVRARVKGFLESIDFEEGREVAEGDLLYTIDPQEFEAAVKAAEANLATAKAEEIRAKEDAERLEGLYKEQKVAARTEYIESQAAYAKATAQVQAAEAALQQAELDLGYTKITAPISGRTNKTRVNVGNLVGQSEPTLLTTIVPWDPMYVEFTIDERLVLDFRRRAAERGTDHAEVQVYLQLSDGSNYPLPGTANYADNRVDPATGTVGVRATFPNPDGLLVPGIFTRVRLPQPSSQSILVPELALQRDLVGWYLLVVSSGSEVERRDVICGATISGMRVIESGLEPTENVIVNGLQRVRIGSRVVAESKPIEWSPPAEGEGDDQPTMESVNQEDDGANEPG